MSDRETMRRPGEPPLPSQPADFDPVGEARMLLRVIGAGAIATLDPDAGHPFASLVAVATDMDGSPLMLLSGLSVHTKNILADPRVSLLMVRGGKGDPLAHPRLTVIGRAVRLEERNNSQRALCRFLARHPKSALYAGFDDFAVFRIMVERGHYNGGFARAARLSSDELLTDLSGAEALQEAEAGAIAHMNDDHAEAVRLYATRLLGRRAGPWHLTSLDPEGCDLACGEETARLLFPQRVTGAGQLRAVLSELARAARAAPSEQPG
jgi:putative heme iron utilization protein